LKATLKQGLYRVSELKNDRYFGIETDNDVLLETLGIHDKNSLQYSPISYAALKIALREVHTSVEDDVFLDFGAGKGRVIIVAATLPFRKVIGVEFAPTLAAIAKENIEHAQHRLTCSDIEILVMNATEFNIPADINILHFYNPFVGKTLSAVLSNIADSLQTTPRKMTSHFANADHFERLLQNENHILKNWITKTKEIPWPYFKQDTPYSNSYRIYSLDSR